MPPSPQLVTFLTGEEPFYAARKSFRAATVPENPPDLVSDYTLGKHFCWFQRELTPGAELLSWAELLRALADQPRTFHIHAQPHDWVPRDELIERNGEFLGEPPGGVRLIALDVDGWDVPYQWWQDADTLHEAIRYGLSEQHLDDLAALPCVCMLSQGAWPGRPIKAHLYYWSDDPIQLEDLRDWAKLVNDRVGFKAVDGAVFRAVQPDYIARRECIRFADPIPEALRVTLLPGNPRAKAFGDIVREEMEDADSSGRRAVLQRQEDELFKGDGWQLIERAGTNGSIDDYAHKAAARIVRQEGKAYVLSNLRTLAERMHQILWQGHDGLGGVRVNSNGTRGSVLDMRTYNITRIEQFLKSACDRKFGNEVDRLVGIVEEALAQGPEALFCDPAIDAAARLQYKWIGHFERVRELIRKKSGLRISTWQKKVDAKTTEHRRSRRIDQTEALNALSVEQHDQQVNLDVVLADKGVNEVAYCNAIMSSFDWLSDGNSTVFIDRRATECHARGGYFVLGADALANAIRHRGMEIITSIGIAASPDWTVKRVSELIGYDLDKKRAMSLNRRAASGQWGERIIATRYHRSRPADGQSLGVVWINLGLEDPGDGTQGRYTCLRCDDHGVTRMTWLEALKQYPDAPVWGTPQFDLGVGANDAGGVDKLLELTNGHDGLRDAPAGEWVKQLFSLIRLRDVDEETYVLTWLVAVVLDWDTKFILQLIGSQGSGKSSAADVLCALVDPKAHENRLETATGLRLGADSLASDKLGFNLRGRTTAVIDNLSTLTGPQQDRLCTIATGVCYSERILYTNLRVDHTISTSLILVGLYSFVTRPDLIDRTYTVTIEKDAYRDLEGGGGMLSLGLELWRVPIMTGLVKFAMAVRRHLNANPTLMSRRDGLYTAVNHLYWGSRAEAMITANRNETNLTILSGDSFALCFIAWLQHDHLNWGPGGRLEGTEMTIDQLLEHYKRWFLGPAHGRVFNVLAADGVTTIPVSIQDRRQDLDNALPRNSKGLGRKLVRLNDMFDDFVSVDKGKRNGFRWVRMTTKRHDVI